MKALNHKRANMPSSIPAIRATRTYKTPPQSTATAQDPDALLKSATTVEIAGLSLSTINRKVRNGTFPAPVKLGKRCTRWKAGDVRAWLQAQEVAK
jgi:prophage regulatory protein